MKRLFLIFKIVLLFVVLSAFMALKPSAFPGTNSPPGTDNKPAEAKPLFYTSMDFPKDMIILKTSENTWLQKGDYIYSIYQENGSYYASWAVEYKSQNVIIKSFSTDPELPVKSGIGTTETVIWGLWRNDAMRLMEISTYKDKFYTYGKAVIKFRTTVFDNLYFSLDPLWPAASEFKIPPPVSGQYIYFRDVIAYRGMMPKYVDGNCTLEIVEGSATIRNSKHFNETQIKFTNADIARGYIRVIIRAKALANSHSDNTSKSYKLFWSE